MNEIVNMQCYFRVAWWSITTYALLCPFSLINLINNELIGYLDKEWWHVHHWWSDGHDNNNNNNITFLVIILVNSSLRSNNDRDALIIILLCMPAHTGSQPTFAPYRWTHAGLMHGTYDSCRTYALYLRLMQDLCMVPVTHAGLM